MQPDYTIIGGGVVGLSVAYGLTRLGRRVTVIDGDDTAYRASRTNFGLVWVQSKGLNAPHYARWSQISAREWRAFADDLRAASGNDLGLRQDGGYDFHLDEDSLAERVAEFERREIEASLAAHRGNLKPVYESLGLSRKTLWERMQKYGLDKAQFGASGAGEVE